MALEAEFCSLEQASNAEGQSLTEEKERTRCGQVVKVVMVVRR